MKVTAKRENTQPESCRDDRPPHSVEAEQGVLGSILVSKGEAIPTVLEKITPEYFYLPAHRTIYNVLIEEWNAGRPFDLIIFTQVLRDRNLLDQIGGHSFVTYLYTFVPTAANIAYYLGIVCEKYSLREIKSAAEHAARLSIQAGAEPEKVVTELESSLESLRSLIGLRNGRLPPIEDGAALIAAEIALPEPVIVGVLDRGAKAVLGGASKSYKTWMLIDFATAVATGTPWLGHETKKGRVLFINLEIQRPFFAKRLKAVSDARKVEVQPGCLEVWNLRGHAADLTTLLPRLLQRIRQDQYSLIILDPVYKLLGERDENKAGDIATLLNEVEKLAVQSGAAVAFGAHYSKGNQAGKESIDRIGGSGVFARDPDTILSFTKHEQEDCFTVEATLRNHAPVEPFVVRWEHPLMRLEEDLDPKQLKKPSGAAEKQYRAQELAELLIHPMSATEWKAAAIEECGMSPATFYRLLKELKKSNAIKKSDATGKKWERSTEGNNDPF